MKRILFVFIFMISSFLLFSQIPDWQWATQAGGSSIDAGSGIAIDDSGNIYLTGGFESTATFGSFTLTSYGSVDIFVAKMDTNGNWLWATKAGGSGSDNGLGIAVDDDGNSYITGKFSYAATFGSFSITGSSYADIFVAKMDSNGNWLWATEAGGVGWDFSSAIAIDDNGNSYITGRFSNTATFGSFTLTSSGYEDIFVAKIDVDGNWLWATEAGGSDYNEYGYAISLDDDNNSYVTGCFGSTATFGSFTLTTSGSSDIFVAKLDENGNWLWVTQAGSTFDDMSYGISIDNYGSSYIIGRFYDTIIFGSYTLFGSGHYDIFVAKLDSNSNWLWATKAGGIEFDKGYAIAIDENRNSYVTGIFSDVATFGTFSLTSYGSIDIFAAKLDANGNWQWATKAGGNSSDYGYAIAIDDNDNSYVTGSFVSTASFGSHSLTCSGECDIFVAKLSDETSAENESIYSINSVSNFPNPFNPSTTIEFSIKNDSKIELTIYNIKGQKVKTVAQNQYEKGNHSIIWNGDDENNKPVASGIYYYMLNANGKSEAMKKCLLLK